MKKPSPQNMLEVYGITMLVLTSIFILVLNTVTYIKNGRETRFFIIVTIVALFMLLTTGVAYLLIKNYRKNGKEFTILYVLDHNLREVSMLLFKRKICPYCDSKIKIAIKKTLIGKGYVNSGDTVLYGNKYEVKFYYKCDNCKREIDLLELGSTREIK